ncbi:MAG: DUF2914 domain-containing protein [Vicinamibacterales bacterium]
MSKSREPRSAIEAAEQAAAAGNYARAEGLLREAALLQEASLGPLHPDLANTLNNLGIVCEMNGNPDEAEQCFRRAVTIATAALEADHPFVLTSRKNLHDFCEARGKPVELPTSSPLVTPTPEAEATASVNPPGESRLLAEPHDLQPPVRGRSVRRFALGALGPIAMLIMILTSARPWLASSERANSPSAIAMDSPREISAPPDAAVSVEKPPSPIETTKAAGKYAPDEMSAGPIAASTHERPAVVRARLCAELDEWRCDPADRPVPPGPLFFYTQVKSASPTTIQHRWYRDDRLHQSVDLRVQASPSLGFRTYSRNVMNGDSAGSWRVELRSEAGALLHEERFTVR